MAMFFGFKQTQGSVPTALGFIVILLVILSGNISFAYAQQDISQNETTTLSANSLSESSASYSSSSKSRLSVAQSDSATQVEDPSSARVSTESISAKRPELSAPNQPSRVSYEKSSGNTAGHLLTVVISLVFILILIFGLSWFVRRFGQGLGYQHQNIKLVATLAVGTRERVVVVDVAGHQVLLGITPTQINLLQHYDEPVIQAPAAKPVSSEFAQKLKNIMAGTPSDNITHNRQP